MNFCHTNLIDLRAQWFWTSRLAILRSDMSWQYSKLIFPFSTSRRLNIVYGGNLPRKQRTIRGVNLEIFPITKQIKFITDVHCLQFVVT